jgi:pimeloyl-ACP methyl ester carboxylesterase
VTPAISPAPDAELNMQLAEVRARYPQRSCCVGGHDWPYIDTGRGDAGKGGTSSGDTSNRHASNGHAEGDTVLLLPGAMGEADTSFQYILALKDGRRVLSLSYPPTIDRLQPLLEGLAAVLEGLGVEKAHVVGGSYSGLVAQHWAAVAPQWAASLLLSNIGSPEPSYAARWRAAAAALRPLPESLVHGVMRATIRRFLPGDSPEQQFWRGYFAETIPTLTKRAMVARLRLAAQMHAEAQRVYARPYGGPTLIVSAQSDALVPAPQQQRLCDLYPQAERAAIADKGHVASLDDAQRYIQLYKDFLCRLEGAMQ